MLKKIASFTTSLLSVAMLCFLLSPAALAAEGCPPPAQNRYACYQKPSQTLLQNVGSCQKNYCPPTMDYKITQTCPQPPTSCSQNKVNTCPTAVNGVQVTVNSNKTTANTTKATTNNNSLSAYAAEVVRLVNQERAQYNLAPLSADSQLAAAAQVRAKEINSKFSHTRPDGSSCFSALREQGLSYRRAGENIAIGQSSPAQVVKAWMDSPGHRANILGDYSKIGIGVNQAQGNFRGYAWAQFFTK